jgi:hypothetical protein
MHRQKQLRLMVQWQRQLGGPVLGIDNQRIYYQMTRGCVPWAHTGRAGSFLISNHDLFHVPGGRLRQEKRGHHHDLR